MLLMDARTCIQIEKICRDIFLAYRLGKISRMSRQISPLTTVVAHVIGTHTVLYLGAEHAVFWSCVDRPKQIWMEIQYH